MLLKRLLALIGSKYSTSIEDNDIPWGNSMISAKGGAVELSRSLYKSNQFVVSTLIYGEQWDATLRFIAKKYPDYSKDSSEYGIYLFDKDGNEIEEVGKKGWTVPGAVPPSTPVCNIYGMADNSKEWTMEAYGTDERIVRGGNVLSSGFATPASYRMPCETSSVVDIAFRIAIYLK